MPPRFPFAGKGDEDDHTIEIAFQQAVPGIPTSGDGYADFDAIDNTEFGDSILDLVEKIKSLWRPEVEAADEGRLRNETLAACQFINLEHDPVYEAVPLVRLGIMTVILAITYRHGH